MGKGYSPHRGWASSNQLKVLQKKKTDTHITHPSHSKEERSWSFGQQMAFGLKL